jgi:hypothetical protein
VAYTIVGPGEREWTVKTGSFETIANVLLPRLRAAASGVPIADVLDYALQSGLYYADLSELLADASRAALFRETLRGVAESLATDSRATAYPRLLDEVRALADLVARGPTPADS